MMRVDGFLLQDANPTAPATTSRPRELASNAAFVLLFCGMVTGFVALVLPPSDVVLYIAYACAGFCGCALLVYAPVALARALEMWNAKKTHPRPV